MAKKDKKKKDKPKGSDAADAVEAVRSAVERTFQATTEGAASTSKRTRNLVDEVAAAASRIRETIEDLKILEDVKGLRTEIEGLARRVAALEVRSDAPSRPAPTKRTPVKRTAAKRTTAKRTPAKRTAAKRTAAKRTAAKRTPAKRTAGQAHHRQSAPRRRSRGRSPRPAPDHGRGVLLARGVPDRHGPGLRDDERRPRTWVRSCRRGCSSTLRFTDVDLVVNIRAVREGEEGNLHWEWSDDVDWEPR